MRRERAALSHLADVPDPEGRQRHLRLPALPADLDTPGRRTRPVLAAHATEALKEDSVSTVQCGTASGYTTHVAAGERACLACCDAHRDASADYRVRAGRTTHALVPYETLGLLLIWVPDHVLQAAEEEMGKPMVQRAIAARHRARRP